MSLLGAVTHLLAGPCNAACPSDGARGNEGFSSNPRSGLRYFLERLTRCRNLATTACIDWLLAANSATVLDSSDFT